MLGHRGNRSKLDADRSRARALLIRLCPAVLLAGVLLLSGWYNFVWHNRTTSLVALQSGAMLIQVVEEAKYADEDFLNDIWYPDRAPTRGILPTAYNLDWNWPSVYREFVSCTGTWWHIRIPLWLLCLIAWVSPFRYALARRARRHPAIDSATTQRGEFFNETLRMRRWAMPAAALAAFVLLVVWALSGWFTLTYHRGNVGEQKFELDLGYGTFAVRTIRADASWLCSSRPYWDIYVHDRYDLCWTLPCVAHNAQSSIGGWTDLVMPLWFAFVGFAGAAALMAWRRRGVRHPGCCHRCGYDLTGNVSGRCPECGKPILAGTAR